MKKFISILLFFAVFAFFGCDGMNSDNPDGTENEEKYISSGVNNKLSESVGENELAGKTVVDEDTNMQFVFTDKTVTSSIVSSANKSARSSAESDFSKTTFNYSYNTSRKNLEFQLAGIWKDENAQEVQNYNNQVTLAGVQYNLLSTALLALLNGDALYQSFEDLGKEYVSKIKNSVTNKATEYVSTQKSILNDYLKSKYESVIHFGYELTSTQLILTEQFKGDLTSASAKFVGEYGEAIITLNDYDNVIPFKVEVPNDEDGYDVYIGVPKVEVSTETTGTITVDMFSYPGNMLESSEDVIQNISSEISNSVKDVLIEALESGELESDSSNETLDGCVDKAIGSFKLKVSYTISGNTLTFTFEADGCPSFLTGASSSKSFDLTYTPLLGATYNIVQ